MINLREGKVWTREEIEAENARIAAIQVVEPTTPPAPDAPRPRQSKAATLAKLMNRISHFQPAAGDEQPAVLDNPRPYCPVCEGNGSIKLRVPIGHPKFGQMVDCPEPNCLARRALKEKQVAVFIARMTRQFGGVKEYYDSASTDDFDSPELYHNPVAVEAARMFIDRQPMVIDGVDKYSLVLSSATPGTGKTYLASIIRNELARRGEMVWFNTVRTMLKAVQSGYDDDAEMNDRAVENALCNAPFLFIDELEINRASGDKMDILEAIINTRMLAKMPTVITTNLNQQKVGDVWNWRIQSRLVHVAWWINMGKTGLRDKSGEISGSGK